MKVVVNADDLGRSEGGDAAILAGLDAGWLTDASVMVTGPNFSGITQALRGRSLGVHLDVSEFAGLTDALAPWQASSSGESPAAVAYPALARDALEEEMLAQVEWAIEAGIQLSHVDSHQHLHWQPVVLHALASVARRFGIPYARGLGNVPPLSVRRRARAWATRTRLRWAGVQVVDAFGPASRGRAALEGGWRVGTLELMCHPGREEPAYVEEIQWLQTVDWASFGATKTAYVDLRTAR